MKVNQWTLGLAAAGVISFGAVTQAEEKPSSQVLTAVSSTTLSGYVSTSAHWNPGKAGASPGFSYSGGTAKADGFNVDVVDITISKPLDEGEWSAGYAAELWLGPDAGILGNPLGAAGGNISLKQAYITLNVPVGNGIIFKMGSFDTIIGYESANSPDNPNYTRSYGNTIEPTSHEGVLASYKVCDSFSMTLGVANSHTAAFGARAGVAGAAQSEKTYLAGIALTAPDSFGFLKGAVLSAGVVDGRFAGTRPTAGGTGDTLNLYVGATVPTPWETLKLGASWDHRQLDRRAGVATADTDSLALYASFSGIEKVKLNARVEYLDNGNGVVALGGAGVGVGGANTSAEVLAATLTADYQLWANVISRLEYRWDHDLGGGRNLPGNLNGVTGAAGNGANNAHLFALNIIYKF